jgi:NADH:ubiquinone oxidoreductase subunit H
MRGTNWRYAPWNDRKLCPTCGRRAETVVGARGYCNACARTMRLFLNERRVAAAEIRPERIDPLSVTP